MRAGFVGFRDGFGGFQCMCMGFVKILLVFNECVRVSSVFVMIFVVYSFMCAGFVDFLDGFGGFQ